ncbi:MAG: ABC transporter permease [Candidatus Krumholzibacteria bacterium]|nr:ABC transporter permease [Candidatus Krumholzibacteria bacterium]MDH4336081.1 ABC transporter permease [Candidatus Krumholzibacteria bacterium]MDH5268343.1 ABC transporter permease [Candidatus Krumholzibacteria bacterium]
MQTRPSRNSLWRENFLQAFDVIRAHRLRTGLLILGVAIGIATVLMMVTVLNGLTSKIYRDMTSANRPYVYAQKFDLLVAGENAEELARRPDFTSDDAEALGRMCPSLDRVSLFAESQGNFVVRYGAEKTPPTTVLGAAETLMEIFTLAIERGRFYTANEVRFKERVIVLAAGPAEDLFGVRNPIGEFVVINGEKYEVVGTLKSRNHIFGSWSDNFVTIPHTTYGKDMQREGDWITLGATVREGIALQRGVEEVTHALRVRRGLRPGEDNNFDVQTSESFVDLVKRVTVPIGIVLTIIASIGLLVGGIGVMNIMLISVTERTREIGVRRAIGAGRGDIMLQFLVEAGTLTGIGGVIGVVAGTGLAYLVSRLIHFPFMLSVPWLVVSLVFSIMVGIGFGLYPARRAGDMDPVNALRYE